MDNKRLYGVNIINRDKAQFEICSGFYNGKLIGINYDLIVLSNKDPNTNYVIDYEIDSDYVFDTKEEAQAKIDDLIKLDKEAEERYRYIF